MKKHSNYLRGAYGPGNIGDDVLMLLNLQLLRRSGARKTIAIGVEDVEAARNLDSDVNWVHIKEPFVSKFTLLGGGGQYFDFGHSKKESQSKVSKLLASLQKQSSFGDIVRRARNLPRTRVD